MGLISLSKLLVATGLAVSRAEAKRLIKQGAVEIDGKKATDEIVYLDRENKNKDG